MTGVEHDSEMSEVPRASGFCNGPQTQENFCATRPSQRMPEPHGTGRIVVRSAQLRPYLVEFPPRRIFPSDKAKGCVIDNRGHTAATDPKGTGR